jgi:tetratricopeptide (TPR) repeat protein
MPGLAAPAFAMLGIAMRVGDTEAPRISARANRLVKFAGVAVAVVAAVSLVMPWIAAREVDSALRGWRAEPQVAFERLARARRFDPLSDRADVYASVIAGEIGDGATQRAALERALERNPHNWYPYMELGVLEMRAGRRASALRYLAKARELNRLETTLIVVEDWLRDGHAPTRKDVNEVLVARAAHLEGGAR